MENIKKCFDDFTFYARVMPVLVIMLPVIILEICKGSITSNILDVSLYTIISIIFLTFASKISREFGKQYEGKMYSELGGMPTTIILRYSNNILDIVTKKRYHKKLNKVINGINLPINEEDENLESDEQYKSAMNWLRNYANTHRQTELRVYQELKEYNFWRNLYGSRFISGGLYLLIAIREFVLIDNFNIRKMFVQPYPTYIYLLIMILSIILLLCSVNKKTVKRKGFDYAKALAEVCERL